MKKYIIFSYFFLNLCLFLTADVGHNNDGTDYAKSGVQTYATIRHGIDGSLFLDPFFLPFFDNIGDCTLLDVGCGAGPWSLYAAQKGAHVFGIDIQESMIKMAKKEAQKLNSAYPISFEVGSVAALPYEDSFFDRAISINVGCNLPQDIFIKHFEELYRVLKAGGKVVITAPAHFATVFSVKNQCKQELYNSLAKVIDLNSQELINEIGSMHGILRATIVEHDGKFMLLQDEQELQEGQPIWRKIPGMVVPNFYHSEKSYLDILQQTGFRLLKVDKPKFENIHEWENNLYGLNKAYYQNYPFIILHCQK